MVWGTSLVRIKNQKVSPGRRESISFSYSFCCSLGRSFLQLQQIKFFAALQVCLEVVFGVNERSSRGGRGGDVALAISLVRMPTEVAISAMHIVASICRWGERGLRDCQCKLAGKPTWLIRISVFGEGNSRRWRRLKEGRRPEVLANCISMERICLKKLTNCQHFHWHYRFYYDILR